MTTREANRSRPALLEMVGISKAFPGVQALLDVSLRLEAGEVLALLGENGAGKSTLIKILAGAHRPDAGSIRIEGREVDIQTPDQAQRLGVAVIYQEFNLVPGLTARDNIFLGRESTRHGFVRRQFELQQAQALFKRIGVEVDPETPCRRLTVAQQQVVEIAKALSWQARIVVMDEPSATLTPPEVERLFGIIRELKAHGIGVLYISHRLEEIFAVADRVTVLRDGRHVASCPVAEVDRRRLIEMMVGRTLEQEFPPRKVSVGPVRLSVRGLTLEPKVRDVSFDVRAGEVVALTGLVGAGRTETARAIFGADRPTGGTVAVDGQRVVIRSPADAIRAGIALLPEDRKAQGLVLSLTARENFGLPNMFRFAPWGWLRHSAERDAFSRYVQSLAIKVASAEQTARQLSGGNQQKVVLAKWLERDAKVLLFDEPTRGIDVGAKYEVYQLINRLAGQGKAILMISSELPEVLGMADRVLVMREGRLAAQIDDPHQATPEDIMRVAVG